MSWARRAEGRALAAASAAALLATSAAALVAAPVARPIDNAKGRCWQPIFSATNTGPQLRTVYA